MGAACAEVRGERALWILGTTRGSVWVECRDSGGNRRLAPAGLWHALPRQASDVTFLPRVKAERMFKNGASIESVSQLASQCTIHLIASWNRLEGLRRTGRETLEHSHPGKVVVCKIKIRCFLFLPWGGWQWLGWEQCQWSGWAVRQQWAGDWLGAAEGLTMFRIILAGRSG